MDEEGEGSVPVVFYKSSRVYVIIEALSFTKEYFKGAEIRERGEETTLTLGAANHHPAGSRRKLRQTHPDSLLVRTVRSTKKISWWYIAVRIYSRSLCSHKHTLSHTH